MMKLLPTVVYDWVDPKNFSLDKYSNDSSIGYFLEDDFDYPDEFDDLHNDYPLADGKIELTEK